ncbi:hypothetical protein ACWEOG_15135 [Amycolatopsis japonica]
MDARRDLDAGRPAAALLTLAASEKLDVGRSTRDDVEYLSQFHELRGAAARDTGQYDLAMSSYIQMQLIERSLQHPLRVLTAQLGMLSSTVTWGRIEVALSALKSIDAAPQLQRNGSMLAEAHFFRARIAEEKCDYRSAQHVASNLLIPVSAHNEAPDLQVSRYILASRLQLVGDQRNLGKSDWYLEQAREKVVPEMSLLRLGQYHVGVACFQLEVGDIDSACSELDTAQSMFALGKINNRTVGILRRAIEAL